MWKIAHKPVHDRENGGGYEKLRILDVSVLGYGFHLWLIRCKEGTRIIPHYDEDNGKCQYKINLNLIKPEAGGELKCDKFIVNTDRLKVYQACKFTHSTSKVEEGLRLDLFVGIDV